MISSFRNLCNTYICNSIKKKPNDFSYGNILQFMLNISLLKICVCALYEAPSSVLCISNKHNKKIKEYKQSLIGFAVLKIIYILMICHFGCSHSNYGYITFRHNLTITNMFYIKSSSYFLSAIRKTYLTGIVIDRPLGH